MDLRLDGRTALVTGAAGGIGAATARRLAAEGALVVVADLDVQRSNDVADAIGGVALELDVTDTTSVRSGVERTAARFGPIDILVNNAGSGQLAMFLDTDEDEWRRVLEVNLVGAMSCAHAVLASMYERRRGTIVNVASEAGRTGVPGGTAYSAAKAGVLGFTRALARESARYGVRVNAVAPGPIATPLLEHGSFATAIGSRVKQELIAATVMGRMGRPDEVSGVIAFLASDDASFVTGETVAVSGGATMQ